MKYFFMRFQLAIVSIALLVTFALTWIIVARYNVRWDFTKEKVFSLSEPTKRLLDELKMDKLEVYAFFPKEDPARQAFEVFLRQCKQIHPNFDYNFYDPDRVPSLAKEYKVNKLYTVVVKYGERIEKIISPSEETLTNALLRLANPKYFDLCFVKGHEEASLEDGGRGGLSVLKTRLLDRNYRIHSAILSPENAPSKCDVILVAGPRRDLGREEYQVLEEAFEEGQSILFLIDPMDAGTGGSFTRFLKKFGVALGDDVVVDKMSRMVGGDFLVPLISQYVTEHPVTKSFDQPTFFPVVRSVHPASKEPDDLEVIPLALSAQESWAERDLKALEIGQSAFHESSDLMGPISVAVSVETREAKPPGRMIIVGDSDFITNAYLDLSGNFTLLSNILHWLVKDDRFIAIEARELEFDPLYLTSTQMTSLQLSTMVFLPGILFIAGAVWVSIRKKVSS